MTGRNHMFAAVGLWKMGEAVNAVLPLLPAERRRAVEAHLEAERTRNAESRGDRLRGFRAREQRRMESVVRPDKVWDDLDPRLRRLLLDRLVVNHGRK